MGNARAGKKGNHRQGRPRGRAPSRGVALSAVEAFAPYLGSRIPEQPSRIGITLDGNSLQAPEPIEELAAAFTLWGLLAVMLWPLTPSMITRAKQGQEATCPFCKLPARSGRCPRCRARWTGTQWERIVIDRGRLTRHRNCNGKSPKEKDGQMPGTS
jgi:hypothetical protein